MRARVRPSAPENRLNKKPTIECPATGEDVPVAEMLYGIKWSRDDVLLDEIREVRESVQEGTKTVVQRIEDQTTLLQRGFLKLFEREQRVIESHCPNVFVLRERKVNR
jgi:hypothetical protein